MNDLSVVELVCVFFLGLYVIKPLFGGLNRMTGLVYLAPLALGILSCAMVVYGFHPEAIPFLAFALVINILAFKRTRYNTLNRHVLIILFLFLTSTGILFYFAPSKIITPSNTPTELIEGTDLRFRLYQAHDPHAPLLILFPGSLHSVDGLASQAQKRGFTVVSCTISAKNSIKTVFKRISAFLWGHSSYRANNAGRFVEEEWQNYINQTLEYLKKQTLIDKTFFIAGYGAAGSAALARFSEKAACEQYPALKGIIALESRLWFAYQPEEHTLHTIPHDTGLLQIGWYTIVNWFIRQLPPKLVVPQINPSAVPVLFLTAGKIRTNNRPYHALIDYARAASSAIIAVPGAGILDYSDYPARYPLISALFFGGFKTVWKRDDFVMGTAALFANCAAEWTAEAGLVRQTKHSDDLYFIVD
jgi:hypothetical protein